MKVLPPNPDEPLKGWLKKKHSHKTVMGKQWGKRFVVINSKRGTLSVSKAEKSEATMVLPLCDVSELRTMDDGLVWNEWHDFCFEVCAPPQRVQLRADTLHEAEKWIAMIREHVDDWKSDIRLKQKARMSGAPAVVASQFSAEMIKQCNLVDVYDDEESSA